MKQGQFACPKCNKQYEIGYGDWKQMEQFLLNCSKCNNCSCCVSCCNCVEIN